MSVGATPQTAGSAAGDAAGSGPAAGSPDPAGRLLARLSVLPALLAMAWLLAGFVLLFIGYFILPMAPYCALLLLGRRRQALLLAGGVLIGAAFGLVDGLVFSRGGPGCSRGRPDASTLRLDHPALLQRGGSCDG